MKKPLLIGIVAFLLAVALASWSWYFLTRESQHTGRVAEFSNPHAARPAPSTLAWRAASTKERSAAIASATAQLQAFKADDYELAAKYQSQGLKKNFPSVADFQRIIQNSYPEFAHYKTAKFGAARATKNGAMVELPVVLTGQNGATVRAVYSMVLESEGYRVAGVTGGGARGGSKRGVPAGVKNLEPLLT